MHLTLSEKKLDPLMRFISPFIPFIFLLKVCCVIYVLLDHVIPEWSNTDPPLTTPVVS